LLAFGVSGGALSAAFEAWRPVLLPVTFLLLGVAFFLTYRKPKKTAQDIYGCEDTTNGNACCSISPTQEKADGTACCPPEGISAGSSLKRFNKVMLWVVTIAVAVFAFFPNYIGLITGDSNSMAAWDDLDKLVVTVEGMTCKACAMKIEKSLLSVSGVSAAEVSYDKKQAVIGISKGAETSRQEILEAISSAGDYTGHFSDQALWTLVIEGMTCESCAYGIKTRLLEVPGVSSASVGYEQARAEVVANPDVSVDALKKAIKDAGFTVKSFQKNE